MKKIRWMVLLASLALALALTGAVLAAQTAPSDLTAEQEGKDVRLRWTPGTDEDYVGQWVSGWENGVPQSLRSWIVKKDLDNVIYSYLNDMEFGKTYKFQISGAIPPEEGSQIYGEKGYSNIATLTLVEPTPAPERSDPPAGEPQPTGLRASSANGEVTVTWVPGNDEDFVAQEFKRRILKKGHRWETLARIPTETREFVDTDVTPGTKYRYRVKGVWDNGKGRISKPVSVVAR